MKRAWSTIILFSMGISIITTLVLPSYGISVVSIHRKIEPMRSYMNYTELEILILENFSVAIKNIGDRDAINVLWIVYRKSWHLFLGEGQQKGVIFSLEAGCQELLCFQQPVLVLGFGPLYLVAKAYADNAQKVTASRYMGFLVGFWIL